MKTLEVTNPHCLLASFLAIAYVPDLTDGDVIKLWRGTEVEYWQYLEDFDEFFQLGEGSKSLQEVLDG